MINRKRKNTTDEISQIFGETTKATLSKAIGGEIEFAPTIQKIPSIFLRPDIGCFVQFSGDYGGLLIINFSKGAALELYRESMLLMGMPAEELAREHTSDEVVDSLGEMVNQIIGKARSVIEEYYGLTAHNNQPKAISIVNEILLSINTLASRNHCRRLSFKIKNQQFHIELCMEQTEFISIGEVQSEKENMDFDSIKAKMETQSKTSETNPTVSSSDLDALFE